MLVSRGCGDLYKVFRQYRPPTRCYSTNINVLRIEGYPNNYKLVVPLPSKGPRVFTLPFGKIKSFIDDMKIDDSSVKEIDILDADDLRLAKSTDISHLVEQDWKLRINNRTYFVKASTHHGVKRPLVDQRSVEKFKEWFMSVSENKQSLDHAMYLQKCQDFGISEQQANDILKELKKLMLIFHFKSHIELESKIYLNPAQLSQAIEQVLLLESVKLPLSERMDRLQKLKDQLAPLEDLYRSLQVRSEKSVKIIAWSVFVGLCAQWILFARLTWWDYSWDVIEPVTYFTTVVETILAGYLYFLCKKDEYTNTDMKHILANWRLKTLSKKHNFDVKNYENLKKEIALLESEVKARIDTTNPNPSPIYS